MAVLSSNRGAYWAVFFRTAARGRSAGRWLIARWPAGSCGRAVAARGAGSSAWAGDDLLPDIGCSPLLVSWPARRTVRPGTPARGAGLDDELGQSSRRCGGRRLRPRRRDLGGLELGCGRDPIAGFEVLLALDA